MQYPDWNHWLPRVHPMDAWGSDFSSSLLLYDYNGTGTGGAVNQWNLQSVLNTGNVSSTVHPAAAPTLSGVGPLFAGKNVPVLVNEFGAWNVAGNTLLTSEIAKYGSSGSTTTSALAANVYSTAQWQLVKTWEFMQEYQLEGYGPVVFGSTYGEPRTWFSDAAFRSSPFMLHIPSNTTGIGGSALTNEYLSSAWYQVQLTLDDSNHASAGTNPIDWGYVYGKLANLYQVSGNPEPLRLVEYLTRGMQVGDNGIAPNTLNSGWSPNQNADISRLVHPTFFPMFNSLAASTTQQILQAMLQSWLTKSSQYTPAQYYAAGTASATYVPNGWYDGLFGDKVMFTIPQFGAAGVSPSLVNQETDWAATVWPLGNWNSLIIPITTGGSGQ
jgi:hypothetical protein